ncbi:MAG TPA: hypothetical protein VK308_01140 [Pyrinomonadaceae bacterium]|nr:hypothetical protein [Pyrinomonadaceae bacterium]
MKANKYISKREHRIIIIVAFAAFVFAFSIFSIQTIKDYNNAILEEQHKLNRLANNTQSISFTACGGMDYRVPFLHFLTLFIFLALYKTKRFLLPSFLTVFYAAVFIYGLSARYDGARLGGEEFSPKVDFLDKVCRAATDFDYLAALFISILLFWQISILLRILIKTLQRKTELP